MCTYNGARYLQQQLDSFAAQQDVDWHLVVSDDGSDDATCAIVEDFAKTHPVTLFRNIRQDSDLAPTQRAARNYMATLTRPDLPLGPDTHVALSDQDDIWRPDKLAHGLRMLQTRRAKAAVYGGQSCHVRADGTVLGPSRMPARPPGLRNALVQNVVSGHSALMTPAAMARLVAAGVPDGIWYHDWWIYLLLSATGADVLVDDHIGLDYRQHASNLMGRGQGTAARLTRLGQILNGAYGRWMQANLTALARSPVTLTPDARTALTLLTEAPVTSRSLRQAGVYRQRTLETFCLHLACGLRKL